MKTGIEIGIYIFVFMAKISQQEKQASKQVTANSAQITIKFFSHDISLLNSYPSFVFKCMSEEKFSILFVPG